jgi:polyphosphate kinase 2 (PPK2 family)
MPLEIIGRNQRCRRVSKMNAALSGRVGGDQRGEKQNTENSHKPPELTRYLKRDAASLMSFAFVVFEEGAIDSLQERSDEPQRKYEQPDASIASHSAQKIVFIGFPFGWGG